MKLEKINDFKSESETGISASQSLPAPMLIIIWSPFSCAHEIRGGGGRGRDGHITSSWLRVPCSLLLVVTLTTALRARQPELTVQINLQRKIPVSVSLSDLDVPRN